MSRRMRQPLCCWGSRGPFNLLLKYTFLNSVVLADSHIPADLDLGSEVHCNEPAPAEVLSTDYLNHLSSLLTNCGLRRAVCQASSATVSGTGLLDSVLPEVLVWGVDASTRGETDREFQTCIIEIQFYFRNQNTWNNLPANLGWEHLEYLN